MIPVTMIMLGVTILILVPFATWEVVGRSGASNAAVNAAFGLSFIATIALSIYAGN